MPNRARLGNCKEGLAQARAVHAGPGPTQEEPRCLGPDLGLCPGLGPGGLVLGGMN